LNFAHDWCSRVDISCVVSGEQYGFFTPQSPKVFFSILWGRWTGKHPPEDLVPNLAKRLETKVNFFFKLGHRLATYKNLCSKYGEFYFFSPLKCGDFGAFFNKRKVCSITPYVNPLSWVTKYPTSTIVKLVITSNIKWATKWLATTFSSPSAEQQQGALVIGCASVW
jgi:hypothetical protein